MFSVYEVEISDNGCVTWLRARWLLEVFVGFLWCHVIYDLRLLGSEERVLGLSILGYGGILGLISRLGCHRS